jgi:hypothetical protein
MDQYSSLKKENEVTSLEHRLAVSGCIAAQKPWLTA